MNTYEFIKIYDIPSVVKHFNYDELLRSKNFDEQLNTSCSSLINVLELSMMNYVPLNEVISYVRMTFDTLISRLLSDELVMDIERKSLTVDHMFDNDGILRFMVKFKYVNRYHEHKIFSNYRKIEINELIAHLPYKIHNTVQEVFLKYK